MGGVLRRWEFFEDKIGCILRRWNGSSKNIPSSNNRSSSKKPLFSDLRLRRMKNSHLRSSKTNNKQKHNFESSVFECEDRRILPVWFSSSKIDRTIANGGRLLRRWRGVFRRWKRFFDLPAPKNEEPLTFDLRNRKNEEPPSSTLPAGKTKNPHLFFFRRPSDICSTVFSSFPGVWIFSPIFHLEDRSENRDRPSTPWVRWRYSHKSSLWRTKIMGGPAVFESENEDTCEFFILHVLRTKMRNMFDFSGPRRQEMGRVVFVSFRDEDNVICRVKNIEIPLKRRGCTLRRSACSPPRVEPPSSYRQLGALRRSRR